MLEICQIRIGNISEMCRGKKLCQETVSVRFLNVSEMWQCFLNMFQDQNTNVSVELVLTDFRQIWKSDTDSFLTPFFVLLHFWDISNSNLTDFLQILESDSFLTHIWHISDSFLTYFCNWHISDCFQTIFWQIYEIGGTNKSKEYPWTCYDM